MKCPNCSVQVNKDANYCSECGHSLKSNCNSCGIENSIIANFCSSCGKNLKSKSEPEAQKKLLQTSEKRRVTVVFIDLVGSTALSQELEAEDYKNRIECFQSICQKSIRRHGGNIHKYLGDGILVFFGFPKAHENDPVNALRSALDIIDNVSIHNDNHQENELINVRIGIHTGDVIAGEVTGARQVLGLTTNVASRIESEAGINTAFVSSTTYNLTRAYFDFIPEGEFHLKGVSDKIELFQLGKWKGIEQRLSTSNKENLSPFTGRDFELNRIIESGQMISENDEKCLLIHGEAGIGKSRLLMEVKDHFDSIDGLSIEMIECSSYNQNSPFYPIIEWLKRKIGSNENEYTEDLIESFLINNEIQSDLDKMIIFDLLSIPHPIEFIRPQIAPNALRSRTMKILIDLFISVDKDDKRKLVIIEDLHWMDSSSIEWFKALLNHLTNNNIRLLVSTRPLKENLSWLEDPPVSIINLQPLNEEDISIITKAKAHDKLLPEDVVKDIYKQTDGNPLFVEEVTLSLLNSNQLKEEANSFQKIDANVKITVPSTLQDALMSRLDDLSESKKIAQLSSVIGREFNYNLINEIAQLDEVLLNESLSQLVANEILYQKDKGKESSFIFKHALIQDTAYNSIVKSEKEQIHRNIADVYINHFPHVTGSQPERIANHLVKGNLKKESLEYWLKGGQIASKSHSNIEAIHLFKEGLRIIDELKLENISSDLELDYLVGLGGAEIVFNGYTHPNVLNAFRKSYELVQENPVAEGTGYVLYGLGVYYLLTSNFRILEGIIDFAVTEGEKNKTYLPQLAGHHLEGVMHAIRGNLKESINQLELTLDLFNPDFPFLYEYTPGGDSKVNASVWQTIALVRSGYFEKANNLITDIQAYAERIKESRTTYHAKAWLAWFYLECKLWRKAEEVIEEYLIIAEKYGDPFFILVAQIINSIAKANQGKTEYVDQFITLYENGLQMGNTFMYMWTEYILLPYSEKHGIENTIEFIQEIIDKVVENELSYSSPEHLRIKTNLLMRVEADEEIISRLHHKALIIAEKQEAKLIELRLAVDMAKYLSEQGKTIEAFKLVNKKYNWFKKDLEYPDLEEARAFLNKISNKKN